VSMSGALNFSLALRMALRSMYHRRVLSLATILGVAMGMMVVGSVLIVDQNSVKTEAHVRESDQRAKALYSRGFGSEAGEMSVQLVPKGGVAKHSRIVPTQEGQARPAASADDVEKAEVGEEDYQAMRLAVRLASLLTFGVGAVIVFFTLRSSVSARAREFSLLLCLGEHRGNVVLSLVIQAFCFGVVGTIVGLLMAFPAAFSLLSLGISTTGRAPMGGFWVPWTELIAMFGVSLFISLSGVVGPALSLYRISVVEILQPRFLASDFDARNLRVRSLGWLLPAFLCASYLSFRPFLKSWLSVVEFFAMEVFFVGLFAAVTLWTMPAILRFAIGVLERILERRYHLEALLAARRMRLTSQKLVFTIGSITIVFSLLMALHTVTHALKQEIVAWSKQATDPYTYYEMERPSPPHLGLSRFYATLREKKIDFFRMSERLAGDFPLRLIHSEELNRVRVAQGRPTLSPGQVILSTTLAARFGAATGDSLLIAKDGEEHSFEIAEIADDVGCFVESVSYVNLKSFAIMTEGNAFFGETLEKSLGQYAMVRPENSAQRYLTRDQHNSISSVYRWVQKGRRQGRSRVGEIDRDFLIFDFILAMTVALAAIGVANSMLIQVDARQREFSVLKVIGIENWDIAKLLLVEGILIGCVGAMLAVGLGNAIGALSVSFLDRFTLFQYGFEFSFPAIISISVLAVATCALSAIYPSWVATNRSSAESLQYE